MQVELNPKKDFIIHLPYNLTLDIIQLGKNSEHADLYDELSWLTEEATDEEVVRIMTAAVILHQVITPTPTVAACINTAVVWERG